MVRVLRVQPDSIAAELGITPGAELLSVDGRALEDFLDWEFLTADDAFELADNHTDPPRLRAAHVAILGVCIAIFVFILYAVQELGWWLTQMAGGFLLMGLVATVIATAMTRAAVGPGPLYGTRTFVLLHTGELFAFAGVGIVAALFAFGFTLLGALRKTGGKRGVAALCIGGGEATALALELA